MNSPQRITRYLVKAVSAGALVIAAALPVAVATSAGAAAPSLTGATVTFNESSAVNGNVPSALAQAAASNFGSGASGQLSITGATGLAFNNGTVTVTTNAPGVTFTGVSESSATALTANFSSTSATVPGSYNLTVTDSNGTSAALASAFTVNAAPTISTTSPTTLSLGAAVNTSVTINGTGFVKGSSQGPYVTLTSTTDATTLLSSDNNTDTAALLAGSGTNGTGTKFGWSTWASATQTAIVVDPNNSFNASTATSGNYTVSVTNPDGGTVTSGAIFSVSSFGVTNVTPSAVPVPSSGVTTTSVTIAGAGFQTGATVTDPNATAITATGYASGVITAAATTGVVVGDMATDTTTSTALPANTYVTAVTGTTITLSSTSTTPGTTDAFSFSPVQIVVSTVAPTSITGTITNATGLASNTRVSLKVTNPSSGNGATQTLAGAYGIGEASSAAATVTSTNTPTLTAGAAATSFVVTGTGLSQYSTITTYVGTSTTNTTTGVTSACTSSTGTTLTCTLTAASGSVAGPDSITVTNDTTASSAFANAFSVAGPVITSQSPAGIAVGAPIGTVITLTGTGFNNTASGALTGGSGLAGVFAYTSPTTATFVVTASPNSTDATNSAGGTDPTLTLTETIAAGVTVKSAPYVIAVTHAPIVNAAITYVSGTTGVGAGAAGQTIVINGQYFATGVTIGSFVNSNGVADTNVVATVKSINLAGTQITATVKVPAGDTNLSDGYTVANTDGGSVKVVAFGTGALVINAGPTITSVSPATVTANSTTNFTIVGTGFTSGSVVSTNGTNATCGAATYVSSTQLTATCTFGAAGTTAASLIVTNADGGSATSAAVLAAATPVTPPKAVNLHTTGSHGVAMVGKTVVITITGGGFYGQPKLTSNAAGVKAVVIKDNGKMLTVRVTVRAGAARGWHTFTIRLANGKMAKVNYLTK